LTPQHLVISSSAPDFTPFSLHLLDKRLFLSLLSVILGLISTALREAD
jgi:hypothetical protein